jgi:DNA-binding transcriptional LysR family regulator
MDRLQCLEVFAEVARRGSFTAAAQHFAMSKSTVTKHVAWLENSLGVRLLIRTTKDVALTDAGTRLLQGSAALLDRYDEITGDVRSSVLAPRGVVRVGIPPSFGTRHLLPVVVRFMARHPDIEVELDLDDTRGSLISERFDATIRIAPRLDDASHIAQALLKAPQALVAAPQYLQRAGTPTCLQDLTRHSCLVNTQKSPTSIWRFSNGGREFPVRVQGTLRSNYGELLQHACLSGQGLSMHPYYMVQDDLTSGRLVQVLPEMTAPCLDIYVIYPARDNMPTRLRVFLDFLREWAQAPPSWSASTCMADAPGAARTTVSHLNLCEKSS